MRCTNLAKLLPLYVEGDLSANEALKVRAHLSACDRCSELAEEFRISQERLHTLAAPEFDEEFYESIRGSVLTAINARPVTRSSFFVMLRQPFFQRPMVAACLLLLIAFGALSAILYSKLSKSSDRMLAVESGLREINPGQFTESSENLAGNASISRADERRFSRTSPASGNLARQKLLLGAQVVAQAEALTRQSSNAASTGAAKTAANDGAASSTSAAATGAIARMEIQTSDPNIRIIWLARKPSE